MKTTGFISSERENVESTRDCVFLDATREAEIVCFYFS